LVHVVLYLHQATLEHQVSLEVYLQGRVVLEVELVGLVAVVEEVEEGLQVTVVLVEVEETVVL
jgi:hypothetical protein